MISWIIAARFQKLPRPSHFDVPQQNGIPFDEICGRKIVNKTPFRIEGIAKMYGVTVDDIKEANPGINVDIPVGFVMKIPQKCTGQMDNELYMDSAKFKSDAIARNGSLLLSFCYMNSDVRTDAEKCEGYLKNGFDEDAKLVDLKKAINYGHLLRIRDRRILNTEQYELRKYDINGKIHYAVRSSSTFFDPGHNIVTRDTHPYKSFYFEEYSDGQLDIEESHFLLD